MELASFILNHNWKSKRVKFELEIWYRQKEIFVRCVKGIENAVCLGPM